jgi:hypothetical protein
MAKTYNKKGTDQAGKPLEESGSNSLKNKDDFQSDQYNPLSQNGYQDLHDGCRLQLLNAPSMIEAAFEVSCNWCEAMWFATPAIISNSRKWALWTVLEKNATKIKAAYVAIDGLRSEPEALALLQNYDCLRFVPAADGSFRANIFRFQRGDLVHVLLGSGYFASPGLMAQLDAMIYWKGKTLDPFAISVDTLLEKAKEKAHVPTGDELDKYSSVFYKGVDLWDILAELGAPFIRSTALDVDLPVLELVVEEREIRKAMNSVRQQLMEAGMRERQQKIGFHGGSDIYTIYWSPSLKLWALFQELDNRYWNAFGTSRPNFEKAIQITVEVNPPRTGVNRRMGGAFARDPKSGDLYFVHRGRIGGGHEGIGANLFWSRFRGGVPMCEPGESNSKVVVVGKVGDPSFPRDLAGFVHEVGRIKAAAN